MMTPLEIERKFLIEKPSNNVLSQLNIVSITYITQTYLLSDDPNIEQRVRKRGNDIGGYKYFYTEKQQVSFGIRTENEQEISEQEYSKLLLDADPNLSPIHKKRTVFSYDEYVFELDEYSFSQQYAILEVELSDIHNKLELPPALNIIKEVTNDENYSNHHLAKAQSFSL